MTAAPRGVEIVCVALGTLGDVLPLAHLLTAAVVRLPAPRPRYAVLHCAEVGPIPYPSVPLPLPVVPPVAPVGPRGTSARAAELDAIVDAIRGLAGGDDGSGSAMALPRLVLMNHWSAGALHAADALGIPWAVLSAGPPPSRHALAAAAAMDAVIAADAGLREWVAYNDHHDDGGRHDDDASESDDEASAPAGPMAAYMHSWMAPLYHDDYTTWRRGRGLRPHLLPPAPPLPPVIYACSEALVGTCCERWGEGCATGSRSSGTAAVAAPVAAVEVVGCVGSCPVHTLADDGGPSGRSSVEQAAGAASPIDWPAADEAMEATLAVSGLKRHHTSTAVTDTATDAAGATACAPASAACAPAAACPPAAKRRRTDSSDVGVTIEAAGPLDVMDVATCPFGGVPADLAAMLAAARRQQRPLSSQPAAASAAACAGNSSAAAAAVGLASVATLPAPSSSAPATATIILLSLGSMPHLGLSPLTDEQWAGVAQRIATALGALVLLQAPPSEPKATAVGGAMHPPGGGASSAAGTAASHASAASCSSVLETVSTVPGRVIALRGPVCHAALLQHGCCDAVVHHGGAGITHAATAAGLPQVVVPLAFDQHDWAARLIDAASAATGETSAAVVDMAHDAIDHGDDATSASSGRASATTAGVSSTAVAAAADALVAALRRVRAPPVPPVAPLAARLRQEARDAPARLAAILQRLRSP